MKIHLKNMWFFVISFNINLLYIDIKLLQLYLLVIKYYIKLNFWKEYVKY